MIRSLAVPLLQRNVDEGKVRILRNFKYSIIFSTTQQHTLYIESPPSDALFTARQDLPDQNAPVTRRQTRSYLKIKLDPRDTEK